MYDLVLKRRFRFAKDRTDKQLRVHQIKAKEKKHELKAVKHFEHCKKGLKYPKHMNRRSSISAIQMATDIPFFKSYIKNLVVPNLALRAALMKFRALSI